MAPDGDRRSGARGKADPPCPICGRPADVILRPFCSKRCADVDLHRWLSGSYRIPAEDEPDDPEGRDDGSTGAG